MKECGFCGKTTEVIFKINMWVHGSEEGEINFCKDCWFDEVKYERVKNIFDPADKLIYGERN